MRITVEISESLLPTARKLADGCALSVEEYLSRIVVEQLPREWWHERTTGAPVSRERFLEVLRNAPDVPPMPKDDIES